MQAHKRHEGRGRPGAEATMRFGIYRGCPLRELPDDYLCWLTTLHCGEPLRTRHDS